MEANISSLPTSPIDVLWGSISHLSDRVKIQLIGRLSDSLLHSDAEKSKKDARNSFLALAGSWNDDAKADDMDKAALDRHSTPLTRNFDFG